MFLIPEGIISQILSPNTQQIQFHFKHSLLEKK